MQRGYAVIPKSTKGARLAENIDVFDFSLSDAEMAEVAKLERYVLSFWRLGFVCVFWIGGWGLEIERTHRVSPGSFSRLRIALSRPQSPRIYTHMDTQEGAL